MKQLSLVLSVTFLFSTKIRLGCRIELNFDCCSSEPMLLVIFLKICKKYFPLSKTRELIFVPAHDIFSTTAPLRQIT